MALPKLSLLALASIVALVLVLMPLESAEASLAIGRYMRPGRSLAVGRTFRPGRSLASGRPYFRPGKRAAEVEEFYMAARDQKYFEEQCKLEIIDEYTNELIEAVKRMVDFERTCADNEEVIEEQPRADQIHRNNGTVTAAN